MLENFETSDSFSSNLQKDYLPGSSSDVFIWSTQPYSSEHWLNLVPLYWSTSYMTSLRLLHITAPTSALYCGQQVFFYCPVETKLINCCEFMKPVQNVNTLSSLPVTVGEFGIITFVPSTRYIRRPSIPTFVVRVKLIMLFDRDHGCW
jgi:hypothetical protein